VHRDGGPRHLERVAAAPLPTIASFVGGAVGAVIMTVLSPTIAGVSLKFGPAEFFGLALFGMSMIIAVSGVSLLKGIIAALVGLLFTTVGYDPLSGVPRFTFGVTQLLSGPTFIPVLIGLFGVAQVLRNVERMGAPATVVTGVKNVLPQLGELWGVRTVLLKSSVIGTFVGSVPGTGCDIAAFAAYAEDALDPAFSQDLEDRPAGRHLGGHGRGPVATGRSP
jgi:putative tricarboxylic transport membrane protein